MTENEKLASFDLVSLRNDHPGIEQNEQSITSSSRNLEHCMHRLLHQKSIP